MSTSQQFCTFYLDSLFFGIEVHKVQEVIRYQEITRVPLAPDMVRGLINLRGQIITAIDLRRRLQLPPRDAEQLPMNVVVRDDDSIVSLLVDEIGDVQEVPADLFDPTPDTLQGEARQLIRGTYKLRERLLSALNISKICSLPDEYLAETAT